MSGYIDTIRVDYQIRNDYVRDKGKEPDNITTVRYEMIMSGKIGKKGGKLDTP